MDNMELKQLIDNWYYEAERGNEDAKTRLIQLAKQNIRDYDTKVSIYSSYVTRWWDDSTDSSDYKFSKDEAKKVIELSIEFLKYIPFDNDRLMFMSIVNNNPEFLYKDIGIVSPEFYNSIFDKILDSRKKDGTDAVYAIAMARSNMKWKCVYEEILTQKKSHNWKIVVEHIETKAKELGWNGEYDT